MRERENMFSMLFICIYFHNCFTHIAPPASESFRQYSFLMLYEQSQMVEHFPSCVISKTHFASLIWYHLCSLYSKTMGARGPMDKVLGSRSEGLVFDSQCWPCVEVSDKLHIPHCLGPPSHNGYMVHRSKVGSIVAGCIGAHLARGEEGKVGWTCVVMESGL